MLGWGDVGQAQDRCCCCRCLLVGAGVEERNNDGCFSASLQHNRRKKGCRRKAGMKAGDCSSRRIFAPAELAPPPIMDSDLPGPGTGCTAEVQKVVQGQSSPPLHPPSGLRAHECPTRDGAAQSSASVGHLGAVMWDQRSCFPPSFPRQAGQRPASSH